MEKKNFREKIRDFFSDATYQARKTNITRPCLEFDDRHLRFVVVVVVHGGGVDHNI